jgi:dihydropteroate synthase
VSERKASVVVMHMQGTPRTRQQNPVYEDVIEEVRTFLLERAAAALAAGIPRDRVILDPGFGFGKKLEHNLALLGHLDRICQLGYTVLAGTSRKSFVGAALGDLPVEERLEGTAATVAVAIERGARIVRVHDVRAMVRVVRMMEAILGA